MAVIKLSVLADAFEECFDEWNQYLNIKTGEIVSFPEDPWLIDEMEDKELLVEIEDPDDYIMLPNQHELKEYSIMKDYAYEYPNKNISERLIAVLNKPKPYRHFKDLIGEMGISEGYYDFRHNAFIEKAKEWCEYKGIDFEE